MPSVRKRCKCPDPKKCEHTWYYTIDAGKNPRTGKRTQKMQGGFKTEKEALREALKMEQQVERGQNVGAPKLADFMETFFEDTVKHEVSSMTYYNQKHMADKFIIPKLGKSAMDKITALQLTHFFSDLVNEDVHRGTIRNIALVLRKTFRAAQKWTIIHSNVMQFVKTPKYKSQTMKVWTKEQVRGFLERSKEYPLHALYNLALNSGMRCGEMLGLRWEDVDFVSNTVTIKRSMKYSLKEKLHEKSTKNTSSMRTLSIPQSTMGTLRTHKETNLPGHYVFHKFGEPLYPSAVSRIFQGDIKRAGMPIIRFHDMRHTHATMLLQMGVNPKVVAERLGHSTVVMTLDTYSHVLPNMQKEVAAALENVIFE